MKELPRSEYLMLLEQYEKNNDISAIKSLVIARCAHDIEFFAEYFFPHYAEYPFNQFHRDSFKKYNFGERAIRRVDAAPRGYAKSTIKVLFKPIHDVCYGLEQFILVISNTDAQAEGRLKEIQSELLGNSLLTDYFGSFFPSRKVGATDYITSCGGITCRFLAAGSGKEIRGLRHGALRPTKIILDDVEHSDEVENEAIREHYEHWFSDVVLKIGSNKTNLEFVGTVIHQQSLLKSLLKNPLYQQGFYQAVISWPTNKELWKKWEDIITNLDDNDRVINAKAFYEQNKIEMDLGVEVLWPEKEPYYYLAMEVIESGMRSFQKEKQNNPITDGDKVFDITKLWWYTETEKGLLIEKNNTLIPWQALTCYGAMDPATGQTKAKGAKKTDFTSIITGYKDLKGRLFVHEDFTKRITPSQFLAKIFDLDEQFKYDRFGVETNLFRNLLTENIKAERNRREKESGKKINVRFLDIDLRENKEKRIYSLEPKVIHGYILFNKKGISEEMLGQLRDFPKAIHDDACDALEMLWGMVTNKYVVGALGQGED